MDHLLMSLYPQLLANPDLRNDYLSLSLFNDFGWLAPLFVFTDYYSYYQDSNPYKDKAFMDFMLGFMAKMDKKNLAKSLKGA